MKLFEFEKLPKNIGPISLRFYESSEFPSLEKPPLLQSGIRRGISWKYTGAHRLQELTCGSVWLFKRVLYVPRNLLADVFILRTFPVVWIGWFSSATVSKNVEVGRHTETIHTKESFFECVIAGAILKGKRNHCFIQHRYHSIAAMLALLELLGKGEENEFMLRCVPS